MTKGIFITATGTDVGKTYISAILVKTLRNAGVNCGYFKPVLSGAYEKDGNLIAGDCEYVLSVTGICGKPSDFVSYQFKNPVSPHLAAQFENTEIKLEKIKNDYLNLKRKYDYIVVEGAGGIACPINLTKEQILLPEIINALDLGVIVVASSKLGGINAAILTCEYARKRGISIKGIILNNYDENSLMERDNKIQIENLTGVHVLAVVPQGADSLNIDNNKLLEVFS